MKFFKKLLLSLFILASVQPAYGWGWNDIISVTKPLKNFITSSITSFVSQVTKAVSEHKMSVGIGVALGVLALTTRYVYGKNLYSGKNEPKPEKENDNSKQPNQKQEEKITYIETKISYDKGQREEEPYKTDTQEPQTYKNYPEQDDGLTQPEAEITIAQPCEPEKQALNSNLIEDYKPNSPKPFKKENDLSESTFFSMNDKWNLLHEESMLAYLNGKFHQHCLASNKLPKEMTDLKISDYPDLIQPGAELVWNLLYTNIQHSDVPYNVANKQDHVQRHGYLIDIIRVCWFMYSLALHKGEAFQEGSFIVHDNGKIFDFLLNYVKKVNPGEWQGNPVKITFNPYGCCRASTHISECQKNGYKHYGIDIRFGNEITGLSDLVYRSAVLPAGQTHILFGKVDENRTFIKLENDGLYYLDGWDQHVKGAVLSVSRKLPVIGSAVSWLFGSDDAPSNRKERIPATIVHKAKELGLTITAIDDILKECQKDSRYRDLMQEVAELYPLDVEGRIGNEVILDAPDLQCSYYYHNDAQQRHKEVIKKIIDIKNLIKQLVQSKDENSIEKIKENIQMIVEETKEKLSSVPELSAIQNFVTSNDAIKRLIKLAEVERNIINNELVSLQKEIDLQFAEAQQQLQTYSKGTTINTRLKIRLDRLKSRFQLGIIPLLDSHSFSNALYQATCSIADKVKTQFAKLCKISENCSETAEVASEFTILANNVRTIAQKFAAVAGKKIENSFGYIHGEAQPAFITCKTKLNDYIETCRSKIEKCFWQDIYVRNNVGQILHDLFSSKDINTFKQVGLTCAQQCNVQYNSLVILEALREDLQNFGEDTFAEILGDALDEVSDVYTHFVNRFTLYASQDEASGKVYGEIMPLIRQINSALCTTTMSVKQPLGTPEEFKHNSISIQKLKFFCYWLQQYSFSNLQNSSELLKDNDFVVI